VCVEYLLNFVYVVYGARKYTACATYLL